MASPEKEKTLADFMLAEYSTLIDRARDFDQINASRINFYMIIVAAVAAGLGAATDLSVPSNDFMWIVLAALVALLVLGLVTFYYTINSILSSIQLYRYAGRVRCWYAEQAPECVRFFPFHPTDERPRFTTRFWTFRSGEAIVAAVNALLAAGILAIFLHLLNFSGKPWPSLVAAALTWPIAWELQRWLFRARMKRADHKVEDRERRFAYGTYEDLFRLEASQADQPAE